VNNEDYIISFKDDDSINFSPNQLLVLRQEAHNNYLKTGYGLFKLLYDIQTERLEAKGYKFPPLLGLINIDKALQEEYSYLADSDISIV
jgi:hypothetical protein